MIGTEDSLWDGVLKVVFGFAFLLPTKNAFMRVLRDAYHPDPTREPFLQYHFPSLGRFLDNRKLK